MLISRSRHSSDLDHSLSCCRLLGVFVVTAVALAAILTGSLACYSPDMKIMGLWSSTLFDRVVMIAGGSFTLIIGNGMCLACCRDNACAEEQEVEEKEHVHHLDRIELKPLYGSLGTTYILQELTGPQDLGYGKWCVPPYGESWEDGLVAMPRESMVVYGSQAQGFFVIQKIDDDRLLYVSALNHQGLDGTSLDNYIKEQHGYGVKIFKLEINGGGGEVEASDCDLSKDKPQVANKQYELEPFHAENLNENESLIELSEVEIIDCVNQLQGKQILLCDGQRSGFFRKNAASTVVKMWGMYNEQVRGPWLKHCLLKEEKRGFKFFKPKRLSPT